MHHARHQIRRFVLVAFGAVLLMLAVRKRDVANVDPDAAPIPAA